MGILNDAVSERRDELIHDLNRSGIYRASDGRYITGLPLADLERINITAINEAMRVYRSNEKVY